jgi:hypothetical protein
VHRLVLQAHTAAGDAVEALIAVAGVTLIDEI